MEGSQCGYSDLKCSGSTPGEPPTTAGGRSLVGGEVNRNERSPQCGVATIEVAGRAINEPKAKFEFSIRCVRILKRERVLSGILRQGCVNKKGYLFHVKHFQEQRRKEMTA